MAQIAVLIFAFAVLGLLVVGLIFARIAWRSSHRLFAVAIPVVVVGAGLLLWSDPSFGWQTLVALLLVLGLGGLGLWVNTSKRKSRRP